MINVMKKKKSQDVSIEELKELVKKGYVTIIGDEEVIRAYLRKPCNTWK